MTSTGKLGMIDDLMEQASEALAQTEYFLAERLANKALGRTRQLNDFQRMARIILPLQEARRQRFQQALDAGGLTRLDEPVSEEMDLQPGCYLIEPPRVGADARRLRLEGLRREIPIAVLCREPRTQLGLWPIVAIGTGVTIRTKVDPPADREHPDLAWFVQSTVELGDWAIDSIDSTIDAVKRVDTLLPRLDAIPEHEGLHQALEEACRDAARAASEPARTGRGASKQRR